MKNILNLILTTVFITGIYGCSSDNSDPASTQTSTDKETVFQPQLDALEKAKKVEGIMKQHEQETRQAVE